MVEIEKILSKEGWKKIDVILSIVNELIKSVTMVQFDMININFLNPTSSTGPKLLLPEHLLEKTF